MPCNTINIANNEKKIGIIGVARDKITYLLKCNKIDERYLVDNQTFYTWK